MDYNQLLTTLNSQLSSTTGTNIFNLMVDSQKIEKDEEDNLMNKIGLAIQREGGN